MDVLKCKGTVDASGHISLDGKFPFQPGNVDVVLIVQPEEKNGSNRYDFSDIAGKLTWKGDALSAQKQLRNEWN